MVTKTIDNLKKKYSKSKKLSLLNVGECYIKDKIYTSCISGTRGHRGLICRVIMSLNREKI
jgi:hypothetical protein